MGIAREVHTEFPYLPSSSLRGKIRSEVERKPDLKTEASQFFGQKIKEGQQPTEGEIWFGDATLLFFPIASLSHHLVWITCPLWLSRWHRWCRVKGLGELIQTCQEQLAGEKGAIISFTAVKLYLQTALLNSNDLEKFDPAPVSTGLEILIKKEDGLLKQLPEKIVILTNEDCIALVEMGLQREVRVALQEEQKLVKGSSFRSEEAIPPEAILFFPWGIKAGKGDESTRLVRQEVEQMLQGRLQFGGLEGLGRGWADLATYSIINQGETHDEA